MTTTTAANFEQARSACLLGIFMFSAITDLKNIPTLSLSVAFPWIYCLADKSKASAQAVKQTTDDAHVLEEI